MAQHAKYEVHVSRTVEAGNRMVAAHEQARNLRRHNQRLKNIKSVMGQQLRDSSHMTRRKQRARTQRLARERRRKGNISVPNRS